MGSPPCRSLSVGAWRMVERKPSGLGSVGLYALTVILSVGAGFVLFTPEWITLSPENSKYWNGLVAFALLGIACDSSFLPITRISAANVRSSVAFIPLLASVMLFDHPWPMLLG